MINYIWGTMIVLSIVCGLFTGRMHEVSDAIFSGTKDAVTLLLSMAGMMGLWTGLMKIADMGGLGSAIAQLFRPFMSKLFPEHDPNSAPIKAISMNITANLLGLGNAATPLGIAAMRELQKSNPSPETATNSMVLFIVMNTASIQLVPTMVALLRQNHGSAAPFEIMPATWLASLCALIFGVVATKMLEKRPDLRLATARPR